MASTTLTVVTTTLAGTSVTAKSLSASSDTMTIQASTAESALDFRTLCIRVVSSTSGAAATLSLGVGTEYSSKGIGAKSITLASEATIIIGGQDFEGARFLSSAGTLVFTQAGAVSSSWEAYQAPRANE